ncbi:MAG: hypothetical protein WBA17_06470 [Saprospiraceae bacterium]
MTKQRIGMILWGLVGLALLASGGAKIFQVQALVDALGAKTIWVGLIEWACVAAMFIPATRRLGFFLMASYLGGIIAIEWIVEGEIPIPGIVLNTLLYVGIGLYAPAMMGYLLGGDRTVA